MNCPVCKEVNLAMSEKQGVEIDYCPQCRGVWLDRGELDKIIEKSLSVAPETQETPREAPRSSQDYSGRDHREAKHGEYYKKKKKEGFLSDLFDF